MNRTADCAFHIDGGFGDHVIAARYIRDLHRHVGGFTFDTYSPHSQIAEWIFKDFSGYQNSYGNRFTWPMISGWYTARIVVTDFVANAGVILTPRIWPKHTRNLLRVIETMEKARQDIKNLDALIINHPYLDNAHAQTAVTMGYRRHNFIHALSGIKYSEVTLPLEVDGDVHAKFDLPKNYITIADGYELSSHTNRHGKYCTKSYPHYEQLIALIKQRFPGIFIVQVGKDAGEPMAGVDRMLLNKTNLRELAGVLKGSLLHIDNESGLVHLATSLGVKCCVIFGPTNLEYFGYDENINIAPSVCGNCYWITEDWMSKCPRGYGEARCLTQRTPASIVQSVSGELDKIASPVFHA